MELLFSIPVKVLTRRMDDLKARFETAKLSLKYLPVDSDTFAVVSLEMNEAHTRFDEIFQLVQLTKDFHLKED